MPELHAERKLARHVRFLYAKGSVYRIENNNLLFHGAVPLDENGEFARVEYGGETFSGRAWMDKCERMARQGYFAPVGSDARRRGRDFLYYLWCGPLSPIFGRDRMASFEHLFVDGEFPERKTLIMHTSKTRMRLWRAAPRGAFCGVWAGF